MIFLTKKSGNGGSFESEAIFDSLSFAAGLGLGTHDVDIVRFSDLLGKVSVYNFNIKEGKVKRVILGDIRGTLYNLVDLGVAVEDIYSSPNYGMGMNINVSNPDKGSMLEHIEGIFSTIKNLDIIADDIYLFIPSFSL